MLIEELFDVHVAKSQSLSKYSDGAVAFVSIVSGTGRAELNGEASTIGPNALVVVPAGTRHNFINIGETTLKLVTLYAPPEHAPGTVHKTKAEALAAERHASAILAEK